MITCMHREGKATAAGEGMQLQVTLITAWLPSQPGLQRFTQEEVCPL